MRYHINLPSAGTYKFKIRYMTYMQSGLAFGTEGAMDSYQMQNTSNAWLTETFDLALPAGKSDLVLKASGNAGIRINWMIIE